MHVSLCAALLLLGAACSGTPRATAQAEDVREGLLQRVGRDQALRDTLTSAMRASGGGVDTALARRVMSQDSTHTLWLRQVLPASGWFRATDVRADGMAAAFLLLQHATDTTLQVAALPALKAGVARGEVLGQDYALLADRIASHRGEAQSYGTQAELRDGRVIFLPIKDSGAVDVRRAELGLPPLATYARVLDSVFRGAR